MTLVTQRASFSASRDDDPVSYDRTLVVLTDSGSNINIIQQKDIKFWVIPKTYENKPGSMNGIGTLPTEGVIGLSIPLQGEKMINGIMKPHVHVYTCEALLVNVIQDPSVLCYHLCHLNRWDTHWKSQGHYEP
jgi:hypothetical protein